jgi:hypothetical protein
VLLAVQGGDRRLGLVIAGHLHESESLAAARIAIVDDLGRHHLTVRAKQLFEFRAIDAVAQVPDVKLLTHLQISWRWE